MRFITVQQAAVLTPWLTSCHRSLLRSLVDKWWVVWQCDSLYCSDVNRCCHVMSQIIAQVIAGGQVVSCVTVFSPCGHCAYVWNPVCNILLANNTNLRLGSYCFQVIVDNKVSLSATWRCLCSTHFFGVNSWLQTSLNCVVWKIFGYLERSECDRQTEGLTDRHYPSNCHAWQCCLIISA